MAAAGCKRHRRATAEATNATGTTRIDCMNATRRAPTPYATLINTMTVAAPGDDPHTAVVPGNTFQRASNAPKTLPAKMTDAMQARNAGHCTNIGLCRSEQLICIRLLSTLAAYD
jgi:hypothetical protein